MSACITNLQAILISVFKANSRPPPRAGPSIRHKTGQWTCLSSLKILLRLFTIYSISSSVLSSLSLRLAPAQKCPSVLLFKMIARKELSLLIYIIFWSSYLIKKLPVREDLLKGHFSLLDYLIQVCRRFRTVQCT